MSGEGLIPSLGDPRLPARFWAKVTPGPLGCWQWTGSLASQGYGQFWDGRKTGRAHRVAYATLVGPVADGHVLDHLCRNRGCVNPAHLEQVDNKTNVLRGIGYTAQKARQTHCVRGHELTAENIYRRPSRPTARFCRQCRAIARRERKARDRRARADSVAQGREETPA